MENRLIESVEKLRINNGDTIVIHPAISHGSKNISHFRDISRRLLEHLQKRHHDIMIVLLYPGQKIETLNEQEMNANGWFRDNNANGNDFEDARKF